MKVKHAVGYWTRLSWRIACWFGEAKIEGSLDKRYLLQIRLVSCLMASLRNVRGNLAAVQKFPDIQRSRIRRNEEMNVEKSIRHQFWCWYFFSYEIWELHWLEAEQILFEWVVTLKQYYSHPSQASTMRLSHGITITFPVSHQAHKLALIHPIEWSSANHSPCHLATKHFGRTCTADQTPTIPRSVHYLGLQTQFVS